MQGAGSEQPTSDAIFKSARDYAKSRGYHFGLEAEGAIQNFANVASHDFSARLAASGSSPEALHATINKAFVRLIDEMIVASNEIPGYSAMHPHAIGEDTLARAMARICPLWPIC